MQPPRAMEPPPAQPGVGVDPHQPPDGSRGTRSLPSVVACARERVAAAGPGEYPFPECKRGGAY